MPSIDRLVALLAIYTRERSLEDLMPSLAIDVVRSPIDTREVTLEFAAESSERMDRVAEVARLVDGFTFTGTSRHFVQYRDATAPFGYDAEELSSGPAGLALYHDRFTQTYESERRIGLRALLLRLMPRSDPSTRLGAGLRFVVAESGLGPALVHYLLRSRVEGDVCMAEWPPESAFDDAPLRRWVVRLPDLPERMRGLLESTPGLTSFVPVGPGVAVEAGFRHPIELRACPVFDPAGLVLVRGRGDEAWAIDRLPQMGALRSLAHADVRAGGREAASAVASPDSEAMRVPLRVVPSTAPWRAVRAAFVPARQLPLLRRIAYALPHATLTQVRAALTTNGAFLRAPDGIESLPIGTFFSELHPGFYLLAGHAIAPAVAPDVLAQAYGTPGSQIVFIGTGARAVTVEESAFVPLEALVLEAPAWEPAVAEAIAHALEEAPVELKAAPIGMLPLQGVEPPPTGG